MRDRTDPTLPASIATRDIARFLGAAFAFSWCAAGIGWALGVEYTGLATVAIGAPFMMGPGLAAWWVQRRRGRGLGEIGLKIDRIGAVWAVVWLVPLVLALATIGVSVLLPEVALDTARDAFVDRFASQLPADDAAALREGVHALPVHPFWLGLGQALLAGATLNLVFALGEELGWRGFLERAWRGLPFWRRNLAIGAIWGVWHAPLILQGHNYPVHPMLGVAMMTVFCVLLSPLHSWARERTGSVLAPALMHGTINASAGLALLPVVGGSDLVVGLTGASGFVVLAVANLGVAWDRTRRSASPAAAVQAAGA